MFAASIGNRFAPPASVMETRGGGKVALVSMGTNYGAAKGVRVEFFEYVKYPEFPKPMPRVFATGRIVDAEELTAWAVISNHKTANVRRRHKVRIKADQSTGWRDAL
jgi:hypothetical protein